ncbi:TlpA family protein disulfide reductase [Fodinibius sediminis]|uniref:Thiol-disulfide isomerase or thioredoxin n=1 Tax=Fodinibius sediminis TaxID=1214077 RepID=A0A521ALE0_9BACT|nr:TlpA disulfide reductase family protein [Fodinibius sediminis]SMO35470.1 Thiol-disulfide isomerase or thioredoxin [Fodinibius sediminis]
MYDTLKKVLPILLAAFIAGCGASGDSEEAASSEQQARPTTVAGHVEQATFTSLDGDTVSVADFKGKVVMIDLWETWCKPCLASFPTLQKLQNEYEDEFVVLAVTPGFTDTKKDARAFAKEHDYNFTYLMDSNGLHKKIGVQGIPFKLYVDAEGNFIKKSMGSYGPDEDYKKVKAIIEKHKNASGEKSQI